MSSEGGGVQVLGKAVLLIFIYMFVHVTINGPYIIPSNDVRPALLYKSHL